MSAIKLDILERNFTMLGHIQGGKFTTKKEDAVSYLFGFNSMEKDNEIKGDDTFTLRPDSDNGFTISKQTKGVRKETKIRFVGQ